MSQAAGTFIPGVTYIILTVGGTDFTLLGAADNNPGTIFIATGIGAGAGTAEPIISGLVHAGSFVVGKSYIINTAGTTDFTDFGSANSTPGTLFTATDTGLVTAGSFIIANSYTISDPGTTDFIAIGAVDNNSGTTFVASDIGIGTGTATQGTGTVAEIYPSYVTFHNVLFNGTLTPSVILVDGPPWYLIRWDQAINDKQMRDDIQAVDDFYGVQAVAGDLTGIVTTMLPNNRSFLDTYVKAIHVIDVKPTLPPAPIDKNLTYWDGIIWKYLYNDAPV